MYTKRLPVQHPTFSFQLPVLPRIVEVLAAVKRTPLLAYKQQQSTWNDYLYCATANNLFFSASSSTQESSSFFCWECNSSSCLSNNTCGYVHEMIFYMHGATDRFFSDSSSARDSSIFFSWKRSSSFCLWKDVHLVMLQCSLWLDIKISPQNLKGTELNRCKKYRDKIAEQV